jgi:2-polyprenyl-3-methyl-5-hydroxy-6-metoxy-1,4-benzoquinol methylase
VGKSTFMASPRCAEITGLPTGTPVVWPATQDRLDEFDGPAPDAFYHFNILRPLDLKRRYEQQGAPKAASAIRSANDFEHERRWVRLNKRPIPKRAVVLVASKQLILERVRKRRTLEHPALRAKREGSNRSYNVARWLGLLEEVNLTVLYQAWCRELRHRGIPYMLVDASDDGYSIIEDEDLLPAIVGDNESTYTKEDIEKILRERNFEYQRVELPFGMHTGGGDRSETRDLIFPQSLAGKSVLDVGSALGYFCFEAEARGAERIVGYELNGKRLRDAMLLKDIKGSEVEFVGRDAVLDPPDERFDYVLLLNVIHHLKEPFRALRQLASITRERLVIEFPTFEDRRFRKSVEIQDPSLYDRLPLVGVSSMRPDVQQTFVFTSAAIRRVLLDHEPLFEEVDILPSPKARRAIAICRKSSIGETAVQ